VPCLKHSFSIHIIAQFVKHFFEILSYNCINGLLAHKVDHQAVGKAYDVRAAVAETPVHTVVVRAGSVRDGDLTVFDCEVIIAHASDADMKCPVDPKIQGLQQRAVTDDLCVGSSFARQEQGDAEADADQQHSGKQDDPVFRLHREYLA